MKKVIDGVTVEMEHRRKAADLRKLSELVQIFSLEIFREFFFVCVSTKTLGKLKDFFHAIILGSSLISSLSWNKTNTRRDNRHSDVVTN